MLINSVLEQIGWGKYQDFLFINCFVSILLATLWMELTSLIMLDYQGEFWEIFLLPVSLNLGSLVGCFIQSFFVGQLGRAPVFQLSSVVSAVGGIFLCCFHLKFMFHIGLLIVGFAVGGDMVIAYTILMESIPQSKNSSLTLLSVGWSLGTSISVLGAYFIEIILECEIPAWKYLLWIGTITSVVSVYTRGFILETPMYLFDRGDFRLGKTLEKIAEANNKYEVTPFIPVSEKDERESDNNFYLTTVLLSFEYLLSNLPYSTLFYFMPQLLAANEQNIQYLIIFFQQLSGVVGIFLASFISGNMLSVSFRSACFCVSGLLVLALCFDLDVWATCVISCLINLTMMSGLSLLYTYSQEIYCTETRGYMNGFLNGISLITSVIGSIVVGHIQNNYGSVSTLWLLASSFLLCSICPIVLHQLIA